MQGQDIAWIAADAWIAEHKEEMIREIQDLVRIPSVSHPEEAAPGAPFGAECRRALDHLLSRGEAYGFRARNMDGWAGAVSMGDEENAIGIAAHLDVVPAGPGWQYPPYEAVYLPERDAIIGRGANDNKGSAVAALFVMRMIRELGIPMRHGIRLYGGVSEENGMADMLHLRENGEKFPSLTLVPDAGFPVNYGQKGSLRGWIRTGIDGNLLSFRSGNAHNIVPDLAECEAAAPYAAACQALEHLEADLKKHLELAETENGVRIRAHGISGHAASPQDSVNAIHLLARALTEMELLTGSGRTAIAMLSRLTEDPFGKSEGAAYEDELSGKTTLVYSIAALKDGVLTVGLDCRFSISYDPETLRGRLEKAWRDMGYEAAELRQSNPFYIPRDDPRVVTLQAAYKAMTGRDDPPYTMGGGTYSQAIPDAISFGFGEQGIQRDYSFLPEGHGLPHGRDEVLWMDKLETGMKIYLAALLALDKLL